MSNCNKLSAELAVEMKRSCWMCRSYRIGEREEMPREKWGRMKEKKQGEKGKACNRKPPAYSPRCMASLVVVLRSHLFALSILHKPLNINLSPNRSITSKFVQVTGAPFDTVASITSWKYSSSRLRKSPSGIPGGRGFLERRQ